MQENVQAISDENEVIQSMNESQKSSAHTYGIISVVLGVIGFFILGIVLSPLGLLYGLKSKKEEQTPWTLPGLIISGIGTAIVVIQLIGGGLALVYLAFQ